MQTARLLQIIEETHQRMLSLSASKGAEYAGSDDRLANFKRLGNRLNLDPRTVLMVYATKHWDSINTYLNDINSGKTRDMAEPIEGRIDDLILYLILLKALVRVLTPAPVVSTCATGDAMDRLGRPDMGGRVLPRKDDPAPPKDDRVRRVSVTLPVIQEAIHALGQACAGPHAAARAALERALQAPIMDDRGVKSLWSWQQEIKRWADEVFPDRTVKGSLSKLVVEEISEFVQSGCQDPNEYADLLIMILDLASQAEIDCEVALEEKMAVNRTRVWSKDPDSGNYHHVEGAARVEIPVVEPPVQGARAPTLDFGQRVKL